jgi:hypothetical protein
VLGCAGLGKARQISGTPRPPCGTVSDILLVLQLYACLRGTPYYGRRILRTGTAVQLCCRGTGCTAVQLYGCRPTSSRKSYGLRLYVVIGHLATIHKLRASTFSARLRAVGNFLLPLMRCALDAT